MMKLKNSSLSSVTRSPLKKLERLLCRMKHSMLLVSVNHLVMSVLRASRSLKESSVHWGLQWLHSVARLQTYGNAAGNLVEGMGPKTGPLLIGQQAKDRVPTIPSHLGSKVTMSKLDVEHASCVAKKGIGGMIAPVIKWVQAMLLLPRWRIVAHRINHQQQQFQSRMLREMDSSCCRGPGVCSWGVRRAGISTHKLGDWLPR